MAKNIVPSKYQLEIFKNYKETDKNIVISSVAGSGKTTTILELLKFAPNYKKVIFLAFNKSIVKELNEKIETNHEVSTLHSLGCKAIFRFCRGKVVVNDYKNYNIAKKLSKNWSSFPKDKIDIYLFNISKIVNYYKLTLQNSYRALEDIIDFYGIDTIGNELKHSCDVLEALEEYNDNYLNNPNNDFMIDFCDMIYLPLKYKKIKLNVYDEVFIDESQDLNLAQQFLVKKIISNNGRFVAVGDPKQAIYGFMGADTNSYYNFLKQENTIELPLSVCYRCGTNIIKKANSVYNIMQSPNNHFEGEVIENGDFDDIKGGDFVICRNNKPLVELYFKFIEKEIPCYIKGSEIGKNIINLINTINFTTKEDLILQLKNKLSLIFEELTLKGINNPTNHHKYQSLLEKVKIVQIIAKKYSSVAKIKYTLDKIFRDVGDGVILQTIHKSKGCETDNVYFFLKNLIPSKSAETVDQKIQENNLLYVGITRAKKKLIFVNNL